MTSDRQSAGTGVFLPARRIPAPLSVSPQAQSLLANPPAFGAPAAGPKDKAAWRAFLNEGRDWFEQRMAERAQPFPALITTHQLSRTALFEVVPETAAPGQDAGAIFYLHGGAFVHGGGLAGAYMSQPLASVAGLRTWCVDYRMPPEHPFPAGLEDALEGYRWVLQHHEHQNIVVAGGSAG